MKRYFPLWGLVSVLVLLASCKVIRMALVTGDNAVLTYAVENSGAQYDFIVTVIDREPDLAFDYRMTNTTGTSGRIFVTRQDLDTAHGQDNYFSGGQHTLKKSTTVWISKAAFKDLQTKGETFFRYTYAGKVVKFTKTAEERYEVMVNGKKVKVPTMLLNDTEGLGHSYRILNNESEPLILEMNLGWTIKIKDVAIRQ